MGITEAEVENPNAGGTFHTAGDSGAFTGSERRRHRMCTLSQHHSPPGRSHELMELLRFIVPSSEPGV